MFYLETPNLHSQNINILFCLQCCNFVIMSTRLHIYIGKALNIYRQAVGSCYGSIDDATAASGLSYLALRVYLPLQVQPVSDVQLLCKLRMLTSLIVGS